MRRVTAKIKNFAGLFFNVSTVHYNIFSDQLDVNQNPRKAEMKSIRLGKGFLGGEEIVRQVCLNAQRFNVNMVAYNTFLIRDMVLT